ncbi:exonuclease domain-containing protein, partial [uncultured Legionella sp.]|uniref:exonuclease domain-containing protein n=1 Tax=uncultured Legionella sp. TaxID=210934 RepID=UPI0026204AC6
MRTLSEHPDYLVLKRVPQSLPHHTPSEERTFIATIVDLETMGLNPSQHEIIELGMLSFSFSADGIHSVVAQYNELNNPGKPIPAEVTKVTGITDADVQGKAIDWARVAHLLQQ